MITAIRQAYSDTFWMLEDGIRKIPDDQWRSGPDDYLIPARIAYHIFKGLEWLTNALPREEFLRTRKYQLDWLGPVDPLPSRDELLADLPSLQAKVMSWLDEANKRDLSGPEGQELVSKALYFLRHTQHHIGEYSIIARLIHCDSPEWK